MPRFFPYAPQGRGNFSHAPQAAYRSIVSSLPYLIGDLDPRPERRNASPFPTSVGQTSTAPGIAAEAARALVEQVRRDGLPYLTATHDVNNPNSGAVMKKLGMVYQYSYEEQWHPKDIPVLFRLYQMDLDGNSGRPYLRYWEQSRVHMVEQGI